MHSKSSLDFPSLLYRLLAADTELAADLAPLMETADADDATEILEETPLAEGPPISVFKQATFSPAQPGLPSSSLVSEGLALPLADPTAASTEAQLQQAKPVTEPQAAQIEQPDAAAKPADQPAAEQNRSPWALLAAGNSAATFPASFAMSQQLPGINTQASAAPGPAIQNPVISVARQSSGQDEARSAGLQIPPKQSTAEQSSTTSAPISPLPSSLALTVTNPTARSLSPDSLALYNYWKEKASLNEPLPANPFRAPVPAPQPSLPTGSGVNKNPVAGAARRRRRASRALKNLSSAPVTNAGSAPVTNAGSASVALPASASPVPVTSRTASAPAPAPAPAPPIQSPEGDPSLTALPAQRPKVLPINCSQGLFFVFPI